jgi:hypothetical protein
MKTDPEKLYDVVIYEIATGKIDSVIGRQMRQWDGTGSGRNSAELRVQTGQSRVNDKYSCTMVEAGRYGKGDILGNLSEVEHERQEVKGAKA